MSARRWPPGWPTTDQWVEFGEVLLGLSRPVPCTDRLEWTSDLAEERQEAAEACTHCPARDHCHAAATSSGEVAGVWGGLDFTPTKKGSTDD